MFSIRVMWVQDKPKQPHKAQTVSVTDSGSSFKWLVSAFNNLHEQNHSSWFKWIWTIPNNGVFMWTNAKRQMTELHAVCGTNKPERWNTSTGSWVKLHNAIQIPPALIGTHKTTNPSTPDSYKHKHCATNQRPSRAERHSDFTKRSQDKWNWKTPQTRKSGMPRDRKASMNSPHVSYLCRNFQ